MDGVLVVDKDKGMTSHDVVDLVRNVFALKKAGHAGTLDPIATGVLVILIGRYTKTFQRIMSDDKDYEATLVLGAASDTGDAWGKIESSGAKAHYTDKEIENVFNRFIGEIEQLPPMYSAVKFNGRKLYEFARQGIDIERKARPVIIKKLEITEISRPCVSFKLTCSKGTYVRQLCADIGMAIGCGAYLSALNRSRSGRFHIDEAMKISELKILTIEELEKRLIQP